MAMQSDITGRHWQVYTAAASVRENIMRNELQRMWWISRNPHTPQRTWVKTRCIRRFSCIGMSSVPERDGWINRGCWTHMMVVYRYKRIQHVGWSPWKWMQLLRARSTDPTNKCWWVWPHHTLTLRLRWSTPHVLVPRRRTIHISIWSKNWNEQKQQT